MTKLQCQLEVLIVCKIKINEYEKERHTSMLRNKSWNMQFVCVVKKDKQKLTFSELLFVGKLTGISFFQAVII